MNESGQEVAGEVKRYIFSKYKIRKQTVEHPFGTLEAWMGATHFQMKTMDHVSTEMSLHVLAYNLKRVMKILGIGPLVQAMNA